MPTLDDIVAGSSSKNKQQLQEALLELLKGNPDILDSVTTRADRQHEGGRSSDRSEGAMKSGDEEDRHSQRSSSVSHPELENSLNRPSYQWQLSDSDDGLDPAWTTATKNMTPRELSRWRRKLFSIYVGHLPHDIRKKEIVQLFSEVGNVQDVHLQPSAKGGTYTYGFVRFCTLEECRDAVTMLHGRFLGNRTITVEFACETKERLSCEDADDLPLDRKDKLLRSDFPKLEHYRPMSEAESQEKMVLWKLRCSATRQKSSNIRFPTDGQGGSKEEVLMNALQEIVKKVASLPAVTLASPSGSEGSPCSPWILKEINGDSSFVPSQQSQPHKPMKEEAIKCNGTKERDIAQVTNIRCNNDMGLADSQKDLGQVQSLPLIGEGQAQSTAANVSNSFSVPDSQSPFQTSLSSNSPGITASPGRNVSANIPGETPLAGRNFSPSIPEVPPSIGHYASPNTPSPGRHTSPISAGVTPSPGRHASPISSGVTPSPGRHVSPITCSPGITPSPGRDFPSSSPDVTSSTGKYTSPNSVAPSHGRYVSPSTSGVAPSPRRDDSSHSEMESNTSDSVSLGSLSPERPVRQHCKFCHAQSPTRGHVSESSLSESTSSSSSHSTSSCAYCQGGEERSGKVDGSHVMADQNGDRYIQYEKPSLKTYGINERGVYGRMPNGNHLSGMGLSSFDSDDQYYNQAHVSSKSRQQIGLSPSNSLSHQGKVMNCADAMRNVRVGPEVKDSKNSTTGSRAPSSNLFHSPRHQSAFGQGSAPQQSHVVVTSQLPKEEVQSAPSVAKLSPVAEHHRQNFSRKEENSIHTGTSTSKPLSPDSTTVQPSAVPTSSPTQSVAPSASATVRPPMQQPFLSNPPHWLRQQPHPLLANLIAARFQQPGFPRNQFGIPPLVAPDVLNPALFQGWDTNALIQQQLLASRLPFRQPFQMGGQQPWPGVGPQGLLQNPVRGFRPPTGGHDIGPVGRGRPFAPRFHSPGVVNIRTHGDLEKSSARVSSASSPERSLSVESPLETQKDTVESNRSTISDAQTGAVTLSPTPPSPSESVTSVPVYSSATKPSSHSISLTSVSDTMPKESIETTGCQVISCSQEPGEKARLSGQEHLFASSPAPTLPKQEGDLAENTETTKASPCKLSPSELLLKERKSELKKIVQGNEMLRWCIDWGTSGGAMDNRDALKREVHLKEVQLQKEKEIMLARKAEQELLYEREKLEAAFDQQLKKELETEQKIGETENKIRLAKLENDLLTLYQSLYGSN